MKNNEIVYALEQPTESHDVFIQKISLDIMIVIAPPLLIRIDRIFIYFFRKVEISGVVCAFEQSKNSTDV